MGKRTRQLLARLSTATDADYAELADIIAMNCMVNFTPANPKLVTEVLTAAELDQVKQALVAQVRANDARDDSYGVFWCLSKFFDPALKPFFRQYLRLYHDRARAALTAMGQIEICLSNLDERIFGGDSFSAMDYNQNLADVRDYLERRESG